MRVSYKFQDFNEEFETNTKDGVPRKEKPYVRRRNGVLNLVVSSPTKFRFFFFGGGGGGGGRGKACGLYWDFYGTV